LEEKLEAQWCIFGGEIRGRVVHFRRRK
jgi:hypothetical protein